MAILRGCNGYEAKGGAGERGLIEPLTMGQHPQGVRVWGAEANNGLPRKERHTDCHLQEEDWGGQDSVVGSGRGGRGETANGATIDRVAPLRGGGEGCGDELPRKGRVTTHEEKTREDGGGRVGCEGAGKGEGRGSGVDWRYSGQTTARGKP